MKHISLIIKDGYKLTEDPFIINGMLKELGERGGCLKTVGYVTACPCMDYTMHGMCSRKLFVPIDKEDTEHEQ